jgi:3-deoxy-D-manno-octulosonate 8-phosphate phosphatase KdsC-like HAD superfamily phosphatase
MVRVGLPVAVGDADSRVKSAAKLTLSRAGGHGAVRELIDSILEAKGLMGEAVASFLPRAGL